MKGRRRYDILLKRLELKVDIVPPSLLMAAAAIESDWGTNRIVREGNSLYKELAWYTDKDLKTPRRPAGSKLSLQDFSQPLRFDEILCTAPQQQR